MKTFFIAFICVISVRTVSAQQVKDNLMPHGSRVTATDSVINGRFKERNITEQKLVKLKALGLDLREQLSHSRTPDERVDAAMLPIVFVGRVLSIENTPCPESEPFHSRVSVQIIKLLKGPRQPGDTIQLLRQSGIALINGQPREVIYSTDPPFTTGDTSVFYLDDISKDPYLATVYKAYIGKRKSAGTTPEYWVRGENKHDVINSVLDYYGSYMALDSFEMEIENVADILDKP